MAKVFKKVKLNTAGMVAVLKSAPVRQEIDHKAQEIATAVRAEPHVQSKAGAEVKVESYTTDRAAAAVLIKHVTGMALEGKYGVLSRNARDASLEFKKR